MLGVFMLNHSTNVEACVKRSLYTNIWCGTCMLPCILFRRANIYIVFFGSSHSRHILYAAIVWASMCKHRNYHETCKCVCVFASIIKISMQRIQINCAKFIRILRSTESYGAMCPRVRNEKEREREWDIVGLCGRMCCVFPNGVW